MVETKRQRYIRLLSKALSDSIMEITHEVFLTEEAAKEIVEILKADEETDRLRGKWITDSDNIPICSECEEPALQRVIYNLRTNVWNTEMRLSNFCPCCGADMRGDRNG